MLWPETQAWAQTWETTTTRERRTGRFLGGNCSHPAPSLRFLTAWEETRCEEQKLLQNPHFTQLRAEVFSLKECVGHLVRLLDSFHRDSPMHILEHVRERACNDKLTQTEGAEHDPIETCSLTTCKPEEEHNRMDVSKHKQQQLEQPQKQEQREEEGTSAEETSEQKRPTQHNNNSLGTEQIKQLRNRRATTRIHVSDHGRYMC